MKLTPEEKQLLIAAVNKMQKEVDELSWLFKEETLTYDAMRDTVWTYAELKTKIIECEEE